MVLEAIINIGPICRKFWREHTSVRIVVFWFGSLIISAIVIMVIATDWITWDRLNRDFVSSTGTYIALLSIYRKGPKCFAACQPGIK